ncbi:Haloacid dehalogenase-like hydrolase domain-containing protein Sgpp, partial [Capsicum annuum]
MATSACGNSNESSSSLATLAPLQAVLFDIDGTLCDSDPFHYLAFREMLLEIGYNGGVPVDEEWFVKIISGKHNDDLVAVLFPDDHERGVNSWMTRKFCLEAGVAAGMSVVGLANRNPSHLLMEAEPVFLIKDYEDPKLWAALDAIDKMSGT